MARGECESPRANSHRIMDFSDFGVPFDEGTEGWAPSAYACAPSSGLCATKSGAQRRSDAGPAQRPPPVRLKLRRPTRQTFRNNDVVMVSALDRVAGRPGYEKLLTPQFLLRHHLAGSRALSRCGRAWRLRSGYYGDGVDGAGVSRRVRRNGMSRLVGGFEFSHGLRRKPT